METKRIILAWMTARRTDCATGKARRLLINAGVIARTLPTGAIIWKDAAVDISSIRDMRAFLGCPMPAPTRMIWLREAGPLGTSDVPFTVPAGLGR